MPQVCRCQSQPSFNLRTCQKSTPKRPFNLANSTNNNESQNTQTCPTSFVPSQNSQSLINNNPRTVVTIETNTNQNNPNEIGNAGTIV